MKTVHVAAAVICDQLESPHRVFATARGYGPQKGQWEFPGGKMEPGETSRQTLIREIQEELNVTVAVGDLIQRIEYDYPEFHLSMDCFWCEIARGQIDLKEAEAAKWLQKEELYTVPWLPADLLIIDSIRAALF